MKRAESPEDPDRRPTRQRADVERTSIILLLALGALWFTLDALRPRPSEPDARERPAASRPGAPQPFVAYAGFDPRIFYWRLLEEAARDEARREGLFFVSLSSVDKSARTQRAALQRALDAGAKGLIIGITPTGVEQIFAEARRSGVPVVIVNQPVAPALADQVDSQIYAVDYLGTHRAATHFLATPGRPRAGRVLVITGDRNSDGARARAKGFRGPLEAAGFHVDVRYCRGWSGGAATDHALEAFADQADPVVAAFAAFETGSVALTVAADRLGRDVPLYGYDVSPAVTAAIEQGDLTATVDQGPQRIGRAAVQHLARILRGEPVEPRTEFVPDLIVSSARRP